MDTQLIGKKLEDFKLFFELFRNSKKESIKDIHNLRIKSRELLSLSDPNDLFYKQLKDVIKVSNKIRDIDVFIEVYCASLPKKYKKKLDIQTIINSENIQRAKEVKKLHFYLNSLVLPNKIKLKTQGSTERIRKLKKSQLYKQELHKYRIFIKTKLYNKKNSSSQNLEEVKRLKKMKDILGTINDNINGIKKLSTYDIKWTLLKKIKKSTKKQNIKLFKEFKILDKKEKMRTDIAVED